MTANNTPTMGNNEVTITGTVSGAPRAAGDEVRFVVDIHDDHGRKSSVDCIATAARCRQTLERVSTGTRVHVRGQLRRRFWRTSQGLASRIIVEAVTVRRIR